MIRQQLAIERAFESHHLMADQQQSQQSKTYHFDPIIYNSRTDIKEKMKKRLRTKADLELIDQNKNTSLVLSYAKARFRKNKANIAVYDIQSSLEDQSSQQNLPKQKKKTKVGGTRKINKKIAKTKPQGIKQMDRSTNETSQFKQSIFQQEKQIQYSFPSNAIQVSQQIIQGSIGYSTYILKSPIIEGNYYLEFKILNSLISQDYKNPSDLRIGICLDSHKYDTPLGYADSIGFSLNKKKIIANRSIQQLQNMKEIDSIEFKPGDIIGLQLNFSPPYRQPNKYKIWEDSLIIYSVNGRQVGSFSQLMQTFYHPAVSMYNGARIEVIEKEEKMTYKPKGCIGYHRINQYRNIYF